MVGPLRRVARLYRHIFEMTLRIGLELLYYLPVLTFGAAPGSIGIEPPGNAVLSCILCRMHPAGD